MSFPGLRRLLAILLLGLAPLAWGGDPLPTDPVAIRNELRALRKQTAGGNPAVAARIDALLKQLQLLQAQRDAAESKAKGEARPDDDEDRAVLTREAVYAKTQEAAAQGKDAALDLAEPVRTEVERIYEEDRDPSVKNPAFYAAMPLLVIDFSTPQAQTLVELLDKFTGIETLILTGGVDGAPVDLPGVLRRAARQPLTELYIINFGRHVSSLPDSIGSFSSLDTLALINNNLSKLPAKVGGLKRLVSLSVDGNPITTIVGVVKTLPNLMELGIAKTNIPEEERAQLKAFLPNAELVAR